jgi:hypothetical protein
MTKKFRHISTGAIASMETRLQKSSLCYIVKGEDYSSALVPAEIIENGKDWEEVKEPEWEILSFEKCGEIYPNKESEHYLLRGDYSIYAVKRL